MRPPEFGEKEIIAAGEAISSSGQIVTAFALRQRVGGGNPTRLKLVWDRYAEAKQRPKADPADELPPEVAEELRVVIASLSDTLGNMVVGLNRRAVKTAERRVAEALHEAKAARELAQREVVDASQAVEALESALSAARVLCEQRSNELDEARKQSQTLSMDAAMLRGKLMSMEESSRASAEAAKAAMSEASQARDEAATLRGQVDALRSQFSDVMHAIKDGRNSKRTTAPSFKAAIERNE